MSIFFLSYYLILILEHGDLFIFLNFLLFLFILLSHLDIVEFNALGRRKIDWGCKVFAVLLFLLFLDG